MGDVRLTRYADKVLALIWKHYQEQLKAGVSRADAAYLGSSEHIREVCNITEPHDDVDDAFRELGGAGLLKNLYADDTIVESELDQSAIVYLENRFKDGMVSVLSFLSQFIP